MGASLGAQLRPSGPASGLEDSDPNTPSSSLSPPTTTVSKSKGTTTQGTLNLTTLRAEGNKNKANLHKKFQQEVDHIIMRLICVRGLVPNLVDSPEWKELMQKLNGIYKLTSGDTFCDSYIPKEAAFVRDRQIDLLTKEDNLTLTFDGTTIRKQESFYTAHATTPARETYFLDGHQGTGEHHNADWIMDRLLKVRTNHMFVLSLVFVEFISQTISSVGEERWAAAVSDSTNVTKAARRQTTERVQTILDLRDSVHHIQLTIKDITFLEEFKPVSRKALVELRQVYSKPSLTVHLVTERTFKIFWKIKLCCGKAP